MKIRRKVLLPIAVVLVGAVGIAVILAMRPHVEPVDPEITAPLVRVERVRPEPVDFVVRAHGTVAPRTESDLIPQVSGPVVWVSPALASGGFFEKDEPLIRIDRADYEVALESARAAVARNTSEHERAKKELKRQQRLANASIASAARYDDAVNGERIAAAALRESLALRERAERDLERTEIVAPYAGRVRDENVDVGQFITRGTSIGRIYAVDFAEVRLPVPDSELRFVDLPMLYRGQSSETSGPPVRLRAQFAGAEYTWNGRVVRTEGEIDARTRMVNVVARVDDPYGRAAGRIYGPVPAKPGAEAEGTLAAETDATLAAETRSGIAAGAEADAAPDAAVEAATPAETAPASPTFHDANAARPPLAVGLFVEAEIRGNRVEGAIVLPRAALRPGSEVLVVDPENRLRHRAIEILRSEDDRVVVGDGLAAGDRVVVSPLPAAVEGMVVRIEETPAEAIGDRDADPREPTASRPGPT